MTGLLSIRAMEAQDVRPDCHAGSTTAGDQNLAGQSVHHRETCTATKLRYSQIFCSVCPTFGQGRSKSWQTWPCYNGDSQRFMIGRLVDVRAHLEVKGLMKELGARNR